MSGSNPPVSMEALLQERDFVRSLARRLVRDEASADDIVQQTWVAALTRPPESRRAVRGWLHGVVRRLTARHWRERSARNRRETVAARPDRVTIRLAPEGRRAARRMRRARPPNPSPLAP